MDILAVEVTRFRLSYVRQLASEMVLQFTVLSDELSVVVLLYQVSAVPVNYFIDERGVIRNVIIGGLSRERLKAEMDLLLE